VKPLRRLVPPPDDDAAGNDETLNETTQRNSPEPPASQEPPRSPTRRSLRGLDWFVFFVADVQTGFGPFVAVYLTAQKWTQIDIGIVLTVGSLVSLVGQMPGGALVDAARSERPVAGLAIVAIAMSALAYATSPIFAVILAAAVLHSAASCVLGPAMAAISLGLVGHAAISERLGRNARFAAVGNGLAAAAMGACGYFLSARAVFFVTAGLLGPALLALRMISPQEVDPERAHGGPPERRSAKLTSELLELIRKRRLLIFAGCIMLFHMANAAMLPLMGSVLTMRSSRWATVLIAACIVGPQVLVAIFSPWVGRKAQVWGRRPLLLAAFVARPLRGLAFAARGISAIISAARSRSSASRRSGRLAMDPRRREGRVDQPACRDPTGCTSTIGSASAGGEWEDIADGRLRQDDPASRCGSRFGFQGAPAHAAPPLRLRPRQCRP
jgi:MFS family permease